MSSDYFDAFIREGQEQITELNNALLALEDDPDDTEKMDDIFRSAHTLKGNFAAMGFEDASDMAHAVEDMLDEMREGNMAVTPERMDLIFEGVDELEAILDDIEETGENSIDSSALVEQFREKLDAEGDDDGADTGGGGESVVDSELGSQDTEGILTVVDDPGRLVAYDGDVYHVRVQIKDRGMAAADGMMTVQGVSRFDLVAAHPPETDIENGDYDGTVDLFVGGGTPDEIESSLGGQQSVEKTVVRPATEEIGALDAEPVGAEPSGRDGTGDDADQPEETPSDGVDAESGGAAGSRSEREPTAAPDAEGSSEPAKTGTTADAAAPDAGGSPERAEAGTATDAAATEPGVEASSGQAVDARQEGSVGTEPAADTTGTATGERADSPPGGRTNASESVSGTGSPAGSAPGTHAAPGDGREAGTPRTREPGPDPESRAGASQGEGGTAVAGGTAGIPRPDSAGDARGRSSGSAGVLDRIRSAVGGFVAAITGTTNGHPNGNGAGKDGRPTAGAGGNGHAPAGNGHPGGHGQATDERSGVGAQAGSTDAGPARGGGAGGGAADTAGQSDRADAARDPTPDAGRAASETATAGTASRDAASTTQDPEPSETNSSEASSRGTDAATSAGAADGRGAPTDSTDDRGTSAATDGTTAAASTKNRGASAGSTDDRTASVDGGADAGSAATAGATSTADADASSSPNADGTQAGIGGVEESPGEDDPWTWDEDDDAPDGDDEDVTGGPADESDDGPERGGDGDGGGGGGDGGGGDGGDGDGGDDGDDASDDRRDSDDVASSVDEIKSVRVDVEQLDELYGQVEQLVTSRIKLRKALEDADVDVEKDLDELDKTTSSLQDTVMDMRLVPMKKIVGKFPRVVRDLAREQGKDVDFTMEGTDVELDRTILDRLSDPLIHILRNAVDHGIEPPEERERAGKPREGSVTLRARRERDRAIIEVEDDGGGLDAEEIRTKAYEEGIRSEDELDSMDDDSTYDLIFHPGFSTTDEVTDVSGRGVGMDVVHNTVTRLDGSVDVDSEPGEGTTVALELPVSIAIVKVLFVEAGDQQFGIPIKKIDKVSRFDGAEHVNGQEMIEREDGLYRIIHLHEALDTVASDGVDADGDDAHEAADGHDGVVSPASGNGDAEEEVGMLIRVRRDERPIALYCDAVSDQEEVVVKPLEGVLSGTPGLSGTAVLGEGNVVPVLDVKTI